MVIETDSRLSTMTPWISTIITTIIITAALHARKLLDKQNYPAYTRKLIPPYRQSTDCLYISVDGALQLPPKASIQ